MPKVEIDLNKLTLDDLIAIEDGAGYKTLRRLISRFVVDETGAAVATEQAEQFAGSLTMGQLKTVNAQIQAAMGGAVSPEAGGG